MKQKTPPSSPPRLSDRFLEWYCHPDFIEEIQGDLYERFRKQVRERGIPYARFMFAWNVLRFFRPSCIKSFQPLTSTIMWNNYVKMGIRNIVKHYGVALLNIFGLTIGLATCFFILLWVRDELSVDRYHENGPELYQVMRNMKANGEIFTTPAAPQPMEAALVEKYPEVVRSSVFSWEEEAVITYKEKTFREKGRFAGQSFFEMFSYPLLIGNPNKVLEDPANVLVSETLAQKLFGSNWRTENLALGQVVELNIDTFRAFTVAGVFQDIPPNSRHQFDLVLSQEVFNVRNSWIDYWDNNRYRMFVQLQPGTDLDNFNQRIKSLIREHVPEEQVDVFLQKYGDGYLYGDFYEGKVTGGRIEYVRIFLVVGLFIFLIACINFMNLSTAQASIRAKEIGIRKTIGAKRAQIISQFISESVLLALLSLVLSGILITILLPYFNELTGKVLAVDFFDPKLLLGAVGLSLFMGLLAGSYPAFVLSSLKETQVLKG
ncbi:MAG: ABC transporter permease, partial [Bacteroidota bacterium]